MAAYVSIATCIASVVPKKTSIATVIVPAQSAGKQVRLIRFGASEVGKAGEKPSAIDLLWGSGSSWERIRQFGLNGTAFESTIDRILVSTGSEALKVVRVNDETDDRTIIAWVDGYLL